MLTIIYPSLTALFEGSAGLCAAKKTSITTRTTHYSKNFLKGEDGNPIALSTSETYEYLHIS